MQDIEVEGVTVFAPPPTTSYRYVIELKSSKLSIRLEDRTSKKQWFKGEMIITDFVSTTNAIPEACVADYVMCFRDILDSKFAENSDVNRYLVTLAEGALRLELVVTIRVLRSTWKAKYTFDLDPVAVKQIDMLESKLRDQQDEIEKLKNLLKTGNNLSFVKLTTSTQQNNSLINWNSAQSIDLISNGCDGKIKILRSGVYMIGAIINGSSETEIQLKRNDEIIQEASSSGYGGSVAVNTIEQLKTNDKLSFSCGLNHVGTSYLTIARLGS
ncbi:uncharacterized protein PHALS_13166 [Plasmopara halstedii]|uniref:Uncharacterized protein n=1 Tax=Plasmopara halstedii TaxID=4781 RepID=A0A0P1AP11_PLAHL|nr:uncharacterized protein PHALS_13166 [Plasmopara halstedii]CEG42932.1 hypothetical protein PHALS_13166 [Plasmopara halstedii]|eukprot:XP_024579301.1 hypothetical protein PHALS_13166 [Plasmopara halstedii]